MPAALSLLTLPIYDTLFLCAIAVVVVFLAREKQAAYAVLKRNFLGYFSNPTGYVFLCLFVLLTSMAAFWPHEFFNNNLGTLHQLNNWFIYIMLFFIPAITMSIWAEERRQGTDELLLTLPADDFDIVVGKYLAAVAIFTTSLLFSQLSTFVVLAFLTEGEVDTGLFFANYLGFWFIGAAMIALGMVASFLTNNLTVGFILGALFNAPLAFAGKADVIAPSREYAQWIKSFSLLEQFDSFGRGVLSLASIAFFSLVAAFGVYLCMVLVGKRHWSGGKEGNQMFLHYFVRVLCFAGIVLAGSMFFRNNDWLRADASQGQVSSVSPTTLRMIKALNPERPIVVDAFISSEVPDSYAKTKYNLISLLREFEIIAQRNKIPLTVRINQNIEPKSDEEDAAKDTFGIEPQTIRVRERGAISDQTIVLGAAFRSGLEKVVVPFFEPGVPVEYELIRSLNTVSRPARKKLGVLKTEAKMMGSMQRRVPEPIIVELKKQYDVVEVDATKPIDKSLYTVMLAVQPSSLSPEEMVNFVDAVKAGIPTAIFEDPMPVAFEMPGTGDPKQAGGPMAMFGGGGPQPKGDIRPLWKALGIEIPGKPKMGSVEPNVCWQQYNPYPVLGSMQQFSDEWLFISNSAPGADNALSNESEITKELQEVMLLYAGVVESDKQNNTKFIPLLTTGTRAGTVELKELNEGAMSGIQQRMKQGKPTGNQTVAVYVESQDNAADSAKVDASKADAKDADSKEPKTDKMPTIKAVYVADADCASQVFFDIRNRPDSFEEIDFRLQNVTFVLNVIDVLAGELDYPKVRRHVPDHRTLRLVEKEADSYRSQAAEKRDEYRNSFAQQQQEAEAEKEKAEAEVKAKLEKIQREGQFDPSKQGELIATLQLYQVRQQQQQRQLDVKLEQMQRERDRNIQKAQANADKTILKIQNKYKFWAVLLPPIPPLLVGIAVFVSRRLREREGISKSRLR